MDPYGYSGSNYAPSPIRIGDLKGRATAAKVMVGVTTVTYAMFNVLPFIYDPNSGRNPEGAIEAMATMGILVFSLGFIAALFVSGITWGRWIGQAYGNLSEAFGEHTETTRTTASWAYVIPVVSLFWPYKHMKEVWTKTAPLSETEDMSDVQIWWMFWIAYNILNQIQFRIGDTLSPSVNLAMNAVTVILLACAAFFAIRVIDAITGFQVTLAANGGHASPDFGYADHLNPTGPTGPTGPTHDGPPGPPPASW